MRLLLVISLGLLAYAVALASVTDGTCAGNPGCLGHICVNDSSCPRGCFCSKLPWEPTGQCR